MTQGLILVRARIGGASTDINIDHEDTNCPLD